MFATSSQRKYWIFEKEDLAKMKSDAHREFIARATKSGSADNNQDFLTETEEFNFCRYYEFVMRDFCRQFVPTVPNYVTGTAFNYFKRFYLRNSVMDFHPFDIFLTSVYLAAKVEEFNISIDQFVENVSCMLVGFDPQEIPEMLDHNELFLMQKLSCQLKIHNPFLPVERFLNDMETRSLPSETVESLRPIVEEFLDHSFLTDVCLLFSPSQIALAAILHAANKRGENIDSYAKDVLLGSDAPEELPKLLEELKQIQTVTAAAIQIQHSDFGLAENIHNKLTLCRNQEYFSKSRANKRKIEEEFEEENGTMRKKARIDEQQQQTEKELLGMTEKEQD